MKNIQFASWLACIILGIIWAVSKEWGASSAFIAAAIVIANLPNEPT